MEGNFIENEVIKSNNIPPYNKELTVSVSNIEQGFMSHKSDEDDYESTDNIITNQI